MSIERPDADRNRRARSSGRGGCDCAPHFAADRSSSEQLLSSLVAA